MMCSMFSLWSLQVLEKLDQEVLDFGLFTELAQRQKLGGRSVISCSWEGILCAIEQIEVLSSTLSYV